MQLNAPAAEHADSQSDDLEDAFTLREFCRVHTIDETTLWRMRRRGEIRAIRITPGRVIITKAEARRWRASRPVA